VLSDGDLSTHTANALEAGTPGIPGPLLQTVDRRLQIALSNTQAVHLFAELQHERPKLRELIFRHIVGSLTFPLRKDLLQIDDKLRSGDDFVSTLRCTVRRLRSRGKSKGEKG